MEAKLFCVTLSFYRRSCFTSTMIVIIIIFVQSNLNLNSNQKDIDTVAERFFFTSNFLQKGDEMAMIPEPVILVQESSLTSLVQDSTTNVGEENHDAEFKNSNLLYPLIDVQQRRKHSLPSLQISEGMMASQVRRLSDFGGESGATISKNDVAFLTTLSQHPATGNAERRHSVITLSNFQPTIFGRNRRDTVTGVIRR